MEKKSRFRIQWSPLNSCLHFNVGHKKSVVEKNGDILTRPEQKESALKEKPAGQLFTL